ncbi:hypothetical protein DWW91_11545 [Parabacteroides sp. AF17-3]|uniref:hypothetical protein n=1 Tax=Parabacteroides sp. AF17-3 TaxID=2293113 RepID=UPI000F00A279|nr:hypothetical protein [Parabacteroides sp. AF17-3]RKU69619.1 hypothetical protein DWW91_11545 [Parabacteroides sp. AF17-3]
MKQIYKQRMTECGKEEEETLLMGPDGTGSIVIQRGEHTIRIVSWEIKVLKSFLDNIMCKERDT